MLIKKNRIPIVHLATIGLLPSPLKKFVYRLKGYRIAPGVKLSLGCVLIGKDVEIGQGSSIGFFTIIRARQITIKRFVKIGAMTAIDTERIFIDDDARINEQVYIGGTKTPESSLTLGKRTIIMQMSYLNPSQPISIGDDSGIGGHCLLFTHGSWNSQLEGYPVKFAPITIGKKVWLPWRVFVMPGVTIGDGVVVGADSMINKDVPARSLVAGSPAKVIKENFPAPLSDTERNRITQEIIDGFVAHLAYHGFEVQKKNNPAGFDMTIQKGPVQAFLYFSDATAVNVTHRNSIVVFSKYPVSANAAGMSVSLFDNTRKGTSDVGEELVTYMSRYGVRFNRLD